MQSFLKSLDVLEELGSSYHFLHASFILDFPFNLEDDSDVFSQNASLLLVNYVALYPRRWNSS
jgi:hypothetical protein